MTTNAAPIVGRSLQLTAPQQLAWTTETLPPLGPHDLLLETQIGAISIGTELPHYRGDSRDAAPPHYPQMTSYENVAIVRDRGAAVTTPTARRAGRGNLRPSHPRGHTRDKGDRCPR